MTETKSKEQERKKSRKEGRQTKRRKDRKKERISEQEKNQQGRTHIKGVKERKQKIEINVWVVLSSTCPQ